MRMCRDKNGTQLHLATWPLGTIGRDDDVFTRGLGDETSKRLRATLFARTTNGRIIHPGHGISEVGAILMLAHETTALFSQNLRSSEGGKQKGIVPHAQNEVFRDRRIKVGFDAMREHITDKTLSAGGKKQPKRGHRREGSNLRQPATANLQDRGSRNHSTRDHEKH